MNAVSAAEAATLVPIGPEERAAALSQVFGPEYAKDFQDPVIFQRQTWLSPAVKQMFKREYPLVSRTLFVEMVYRRRPHYSETVLDDFAALSAKKLEDIQRLLKNNVDRLRAICSSNGADQDATYMHPENRVVPIIAGGARGYLKCLELLDQVYALTGAGILFGIIDAQQRKKMEMQCRQAVRAYSAMLRHESVKLWKESQRVHAAGKAEADPEVHKAERAHGEAVQDYDKHSEDDRPDPSGAVSPAAAAQVISDLATTSEAQAKPSRRKKSDAVEATPPASPPAGAPSEGAPAVAS